MYSYVPWTSEKMCYIKFRWSAGGLLQSNVVEGLESLERIHNNE